MAKITIGAQLKSYRERVLELTQMQFAALLGMGVASINRYENGAEPTPAHRQFLEGIFDAEVLFRLLKDKHDILGATTFKRLSVIAAREGEQKDLRRISTIQSKCIEPEVTGGRQFDLERLIEMIRFFTREGEWKTKLNKLLFYSDFFAFQRLGRSISGTRYVVGSYGPIPDGQELIYAVLASTGMVQAREEFIRESGEPVEKLITPVEFDRRKFTGKELRVLEGIKDFFSRMTAKEVADYSHAEEFYQAYSLGVSIPYPDGSKLRPIPFGTLDTAAKGSIADIAERLAANVPSKEFEKLPKDGAKEVDHYLYGHKKRTK